MWNVSAIDESLQQIRRIWDREMRYSQCFSRQVKVERGWLSINKERVEKCA